MDLCHTSRQYNNEIQQLKDQLLNMGYLVRQQLGSIVQLLQADPGMAWASAVERECRIDEHEIQIDRHCHHILLRRQPVAGDLRWLNAVSKLNTCFECIADLCERVLQKLAPVATQLQNTSPIQPYAQVLANDTLTTFNLVLESFALNRAHAAEQALVNARRLSDAHQLVTFGML